MSLLRIYEVLCADLGSALPTSSRRVIREEYDITMSLNYDGQRSLEQTDFRHVMNALRGTCGGGRTLKPTIAITGVAAGQRCCVTDVWAGRR